MRSRYKKIMQPFIMEKLKKPLPERKELPFIFVVNIHKGRRGRIALNGWDDPLLPMQYM